MYQISNSTTKQSVYTALASQTREFKHRLSFGTGFGTKFTKQIDFDNGIKKIEISQVGNADSGGLVLGNCCSSSVKLEFYNTHKDYSYNGKTVYIECGIKLASGDFYYIPCGYYTCEKPETEDDWNTVKITAYDVVDRMTAKWNTNIKFPATANDLIDEIAEKYQVSAIASSAVLNKLNARTITEAEASMLTAYTEREVFGYLVGCVGANARANSVGKIQIYRYELGASPVFEVLSSMQWQNGFKKTSESEFVINSITSGIDNNVFTTGTGKGLTFANPLITEAEIADIYQLYRNTSFQPSECEWRGNPCVECGDVVWVTDKKGHSHRVLIAQQEISLTGGLSSKIKCPSGDASISFDTVNEQTRKALNKQYSELQQAIADATEKINGSQGGFFEILDSDGDGNPDGWLIKENEDGSGGLIRANKAGIALSEDGGTTYRTAITYDGINADLITSGKVKAEFIETDQLFVSKNNVDGLDTELQALLDAANEADEKAGNAQTTANSAISTASEANTNASNALSVANSANGKIANWASANNTTLIDGAKIYTGSITASQIASGAITAEKIDTGAITAEKVNVGWQSGNCATGWSSDKESYITVTSDSSNNNNPKIAVSTSYTSGNIDVNGIPFYASAGDVLRFGGTAYKKSTGDNGIYLKYSSKSDEKYNVVSYQNTATNANGSTVVIDKSYTVTQAGWYMITVAFNKQASGAYVTNLYCYKDVKGEMIVNGKISSIDGKTYFDLDNNEMGCANGYYTSQYTSGKLRFKYSSYDVGAIEGYVAESTAANRRLMIYSPNIIELGIGDSPLTASGSAVTINDDQIGTMKPIWARRNIRAVNQSNVNDYVEMTTDSSRGGTLYMQKRIDSSSAVWGYMYLGTDGHVYWYGSIGTVQIA